MENFLTKGDVFRLFLRYVDEATMGGASVDVTQYADYQDKFGYYLDTAVKYLAKYRPIKARLTAGEGDTIIDRSLPGQILISLPSYVDRVNSIENSTGEVEWRMKGAGTVVIGGGVSLPVVVYFNKLPDYIPPDAPDASTFELDAEVQPLIALKTAVMATQSDNPVLSTNLQNQFNQVAAAILNSPRTYTNSVGTVITMG